MNALEVNLEAIRGCLAGVIPSAFATCAADGTPNVTYISSVHYVGADRVALSRQFFNKSAANLVQNPQAQVLVIDPVGGAQYLLDLAYVETETEGPTFDAIAANLEAIASQTGHASHLRGVDIYRVLACGPLHPESPPPGDSRLSPDVLRQLESFLGRLSQSADPDALPRHAMELLADVFGFRHGILLVRDGPVFRGWAAAGYSVAAGTVESPLGEGLLEVCVRRRQTIAIPHRARSGVMAAEGAGDPAAAAGSFPRPLELPGPRSVQSLAAIPLTAYGAVVGVLYFESEQVGAFGPHNEQLLRILGVHLETCLAARLEVSRGRWPAETPAAVEQAEPNAQLVQVDYYQADDTVFVDGQYIIKGVPGRILFKLVREKLTTGREIFTNRELRLDESLGLPPGNDNLDSRLVSLRRRLHEKRCGIELERVGRGQLRLAVTSRVRVAEIPTSGPMRHAHERHRPAELRDF